MSPQAIAHYRITSKLGEGGMGEVWRATDTKLGRDVAIKVLPEAFARDPDRMARFTREAQLLASLNHPNIAAIYGVEERALVMELVEGPTLAERIATGPIPLDDALPIAKQIAEALEYAHERSIIHRDLKPANIKITPEGRVKVLDFGLAKAAEEPSATGNASDSPTQTLTATRAGVILGTAAYMSPEQARGAAVDKRSDIWSFGVVLYEMLTGRHLFRGDTVSDTLAGVLKTDPDWGALPLNTPPAVRKLLRRCLERDRNRRLHDIADARIEIEEALAEPAPPAALPARNRRRLGGSQRQGCCSAPSAYGNCGG
jgi:serine/threonine-protein kinase